MLAAALFGTALLASIAVPTALAKDGNRVERIRIRDNCDPKTFKAANVPCAPVGGNVTFEKFIGFISARPQHVLKEENALGWRFSPDEAHVKRGTTLAVKNEGGEGHTFTRVTAFHDLGCIPPINQAMFGTSAVDPLCPAPFVPPSPVLGPGDTASPPLNQAGTYRFQCFIHPWMRTTVEVRSS
jgi:plastocyanin